MFLKSLEIRGFKSFADKTELKFDKGVTAVVGPNGSGKSNISDAVRWVLGEQSVKTLRGGKMEDVIFAGTHYRKPVGVAQVSLTLDNYEKELSLDYSDVTITRRIYRSGESEYLINNTPCRLKDITTLFMDTGIGKEGYSLIGQGKIDAILSGRADERRSLLEEAAGIVKFKSRRDEAERKLRNTDENLVRINDILSTYEERIGPLEEESIKAEKFVELSNSLKQKEIDFLLFGIKNVEGNIKLHQEEINKIELKNSELREDIKERRETLSLRQKEIEDLESQTNQERIDYFKGKEKIGELKEEISVLTERILNLKELIENNEKEKIAIIQKIKDLEVEKNNILQEVNKEKDKLALIEEKVKTLEDETNKVLNSISSEEEKVESLKEEEIECYRKIAELEKVWDFSENSIKLLEERRNSAQGDKEKLNNSLAINYSTKEILTKKINEIKIQNETIQKEITENRSKISKLQGDISKTEQNFRQINIDINRNDATYKMLSNLEKHFEGYNKSVKVLIDHLSKGYVNGSEGKYAILGEVISVPENLETAIEISLGGAISNVITDNEIIAKEMINYLKTHKLGRATFLPLTIIKSKKAIVSEHISRIKGYIGIASDLISFEGKYEKAINYSLGRTLIAEDMDGALRVAKETSYSFKIVTLTGEVVNPGGALTGGNFAGRNSSIISRKRELEELQKGHKLLEEQINKTKITLENLRDNLKKLDEENLNKKDGIHFNNVEMARLQNEFKNIESEGVKLEESIKNLVFSQGELEKEYTFLRGKMNKVKEEIEVVKNKKHKNKIKIKGIEEELRGSKEAITRNRDEITDNRIKKASIEELTWSKLRDFNRMEQEFEECNKRIKEIERSIANGEETQRVSKESIEKNSLEIDKIIDVIDNYEALWKKSEVKRISTKENINKIEGELEALNGILQRSENEYHKIEMGKAKYDVEKENFFKRLNEEFNLTYAEALEDANEVTDESEQKSCISALKSKITSLGMVNVGAIQEYKEVKEKYTFMNNQREDLENAKGDLLEVIGDMTSKMKEVFIDNFKILNKNFSETFKELFKGGSAELILGDGDELTSSIDINVQPPGKKVQNINLMSGGEKVLSAIALMFSILKMKPTPFCILDEIEAALDDANVYRYAEFLRKFSENIQFIIVTHRKGTMEASDILYGVTMEEKGVSKIVSVNLQDKQEE